MKKIVVLLMLVAVLLSSCKQAVSTDTISNNVPPQAADYQWKDDEYYLDKYITALDIALGGDNGLLFTDAAQINTNTLYVFFAYIVSTEELYDYESWYHQDDQMYHIPADIIEQTIKKYLNVGTIKMEDIPSYDKINNEVIKNAFAGFGGGRFPKINNKEYIKDNVIRLTVGFYDENYSQMIYEKVYTIQINPDNEKEYKYLSIEKN